MLLHGGSSPVQHSVEQSRSLVLIVCSAVSGPWPADVSKIAANGYPRLSATHLALNMTIAVVLGVDRNDGGHVVCCGAQ